MPQDDPPSDARRRAPPPPPRPPLFMPALRRAPVDLKPIVAGSPPPTPAPPPSSPFSQQEKRGGTGLVVQADKAIKEPAVCQCGKGYVSAYDGKCGHCRSGREQRLHINQIATQRADPRQNSTPSSSPFMMPAQVQVPPPPPPMSAPKTPPRGTLSPPAASPGGTTQSQNSSAAPQAKEMNLIDLPPLPGDPVRPLTSLVIPGLIIPRPTPSAPPMDMTPVADSLIQAPALSRFTRVNATQVRYEAKSKVNPTGGVIPEAMAEATAAALDVLEEKIGDIDQWVSGRLGWSIDDLGARLSSEQIDAVALGIDAMDRGEGLIVADMTGFGKGRILASLALANIRDGRKVVFLTEKENLFSDFWRDVVDIEAGDIFGRPYILNKDSRIIDMSDINGRVLHATWKPSERKAVIESRDLPDDVRVMLATYSQFNRSSGAKLEFLHEVIEGALLIPDEAHNFVGEDSTTSRNIGAALLKAHASIFSSATFARDIHNLGAYKSVFPWLRRMGDVTSWTPAQRRAVAEESVRLAAKSGRAIRREHDLSTVRLQVVEDTERKARNEELHGALAPILSDMARLGALVFRKIMELNEANKMALSALPAAERKAHRETWAAANFGSRLNAIIGQFLVAIELDLCVDECVKALRAGKKPVVVIESTMESLMRELARDTASQATGDEQEIREEDNPEQADESVDTSATRPPTFREALLVMADRLLRISHRTGTGEKSVITLDDPAMMKMHAAIKEQAAQFPDLPLSPIDDLRDRIEAIGRDLHAKGEIPQPWAVDEVSARSMRVKDGKYAAMPNGDRNVTVARFNANVVHALILTLAGSTGLSIHDGPKAPHHAPRVMLMLRAPRDPLRYVQTLGRVLRRGQLTEPEFIALSSGLDAQVYEMAASNRKMVELSASVTGEGKSTMVFDVPDPIDAVGNMVAYDLLWDNQHLAEMMAISLNVEREQADQELYFVNKLMRRLWLLPPRSCRAMFSALVQGRAERLAGGAAIHHDGHTLPGEWSIAKREILEPGNGENDPLDGNDTYLTTLRQTRQVNPVSWPEAIKLAKNGATSLNQQNIQALIKEISETLPKSMESVLPRRRFKSVAVALRDQDDNSVKRIKAKADTIKFLLQKASPGSPALLPADDGEMRQSLIVGVHLAQPGMALRSRDYHLQYLVAGEMAPRKISFEAVHRIMDQARFSGMEVAERLIPFFDKAPKGTVLIERKIIDGNGLAAVLAARRLGGGTRASYILQGGEKCSGILVPKNLERKIIDLPGRVTNADECFAVLSAFGEVLCHIPGAAEPMRLAPMRLGGVALEMPPSRKDQHRYTEVLKGANLDIDFAKSAPWAVPKAKIPDVYRVLSSGGGVLQFPARHRRAIEENRRNKKASAVTDASLESDASVGEERRRML